MNQQYSEEQDISGESETDVGKCHKVIKCHRKTVNRLVYTNTAVQMYWHPANHILLSWHSLSV